MTPFKRLVSYFKPYRAVLIFGGSCVFVTNLFKLIAPNVLGIAIDALKKPGTTPQTMLRYGGMLLLVALAQGIFLFIQRRVLINMSRHIEYDLRNDFYAHLQKLPFQFYQTQRTGDLMARATNDLSAVRMIVGPALMYSMNTLFAMALLVPKMASINWRLTLLAFMSMPLVVMATNYFSKRIHDRFEQVQTYFGTVSNRAQESLAGVRVIRAYTQERAEEASFKTVNREFVNRNLRLIRLSGIFHPLLQFFIGLGFIAVLWYGGRLVIRGNEGLAGGISIGQFVQFTLYLGFLVWPMIALGWVINIFQRGMASMGRMDQVLSIEPAIRDVAQKSEITEIAGEIEFRSLTFKYNDASEPALADINLRIAPGQTVAFVGAVGSGKSTLMNLVPRLLDAEPGQVLIDGHPIQEIPLAVLRSSIGYVPQETFLFSETVAGNISFGVESASQEEIEQAATEAGIADDIRGFPRGFETLVGERGITLSGGQKQRAAIARALIRRPRILILDDALSSVDTYTEEKILRHLREIMVGRTSLIVSHRVSTVKDADLIVVLEEARIAERGTHEELIDRGGIYAELHEKQLLEEELAAS
ncbi:MAG TPA: ABC transporter ATP-binding protein [Blastocatellia bacterium]|jgi:ATP-binding cassette subfamily B protein|nr:ABC transporter ATP-binding protein [Blastocatellia bacterium]